MNRELIEALEETDKDLCVLEGTMLDIEKTNPRAEGMVNLIKKWRERNKKALQKAKEQPTKNADEFLKSIGITSLERVWERYLSTGKTLADLLEEYSNQSKWISVEDRLPEKNEDVFTFDNEGYIDVCVYEFRADENVFMVTDTCTVLNKVTHWQPLPQPPVTNDKQ